MKKLKVLTVVGTRPEIIRLSRVLARLDDPFTDKDLLLRRLHLERPENRSLEWKLTLPIGTSASLPEFYWTLDRIRQRTTSSGDRRALALRAFSGTLIKEGGKSAPRWMNS